MVVGVVALVIVAAAVAEDAVRVVVAVVAVAVEVVDVARVSVEAMGVMISVVAISMVVAASVTCMDADLSYDDKDRRRSQCNHGSIKLNTVIKDKIVY
ncbi:hypothetical protein DPMN_110740 [Dreissena polymorpha]|uniref:Uncharacterized protein n=1 Tax=Dreissena polymorpha TaxID=45954 RepID=A0A9D4KD81_DREPO|nr:hypothetical protein DPMN_110740 [Dreissena polymorpha]